MREISLFDLFNILVYKVMDSIKICISFKSGNKITKVYVRVFGVYTLLGVISQFDYIWRTLSKDERFPTDAGHVVSVEDADASRLRPDFLVRL